MPFQKGHKKHGGRAKGHKETLEARLSEDILFSYKKMGGKQALLTWGTKNQDEFFKFLKQTMSTKKVSSNDKEIKFVEDLKK